MRPAAVCNGSDFDRIEKALRSELHLLRRAILEQKGEFVSGITRDDVVGANLGLEPADGGGDHLIADVIAIGAVEA